MIPLICLVAAAVCFVLAAIAPQGLPARPSLVPTGLALWVLSVLLDLLQHFR
jgi:hypothetical protein